MVAENILNRLHKGRPWLLAAIHALTPRSKVKGWFRIIGWVRGLDLYVDMTAHFVVLL